MTPFKLERMPTQSYEKNDMAQFDIIIEMGLDQKTIKRKIYNYTDLLSDVGGLQSILVSWIALLLFAWNYNSLENYMVTRLFKVRAKAEYDPPHAPPSPPATKVSD